jgi:hypothetical protein
MRLEGLGKLKNLMTSWGIEPATFRLVPQPTTLHIRRLINDAESTGKDIWQRLELFKVSRQMDYKASTEMGEILWLVSE